MLSRERCHTPLYYAVFWASLFFALHKHVSACESLLVKLLALVLPGISLSLLFPSPHCMFLKFMSPPVSSQYRRTETNYIITTSSEWSRLTAADSLRSEDKSTFNPKAFESKLRALLLLVNSSGSEQNPALLLVFMKLRLCASTPPGHPHTKLSKLQNIFTSKWITSTKPELAIVEKINWSLKEECFTLQDKITYFVNGVWWVVRWGKRGQQTCLFWCEMLVL